MMRKRPAIAMDSDGSEPHTTTTAGLAASAATAAAARADPTPHDARHTTTTGGNSDVASRMDEHDSSVEAAAAVDAAGAQAGHERCHRHATRTTRAHTSDDCSTRNMQQTQHVTDESHTQTTRSESPPPPESPSAMRAHSAAAAAHTAGLQLRLGLDSSGNSAPNTAPSTPKRRPSPSARTPHSALVVGGGGGGGGKPPTSPASSAAAAAAAASAAASSSSMDPRFRRDVHQRMQRSSTMGLQEARIAADGAASLRAAAAAAAGSSSSPCSPKLGFKPAPSSVDSHTPLRLPGTSGLLAVHLIHAAPSPPGSTMTGAAFGFGFSSASHSASASPAAAFPSFQGLDFHAQDAHTGGGGGGVPSGSTSTSSHHSHSSSHGSGGFSPFSSPILSSSRGSPLAGSAHLHTPPAAPPPMMLGLPVPDFTNTEQARNQSPALRNRSRLQSGILAGPPPTPQAGAGAGAGSPSSHSIGRSLISSFGAAHHSADRDATSQPMSAAESYSSVLSAQHHNHHHSSGGGGLGGGSLHHVSSVSMPSTPSRSATHFKRRLVERSELEKDMKLFSFVASKPLPGMHIVAPITAAHSYSIAKAAAATIAAMPRSPLFSSTAAQQPGDSFSRSLRVSRSPGLMPASSCLLFAPLSLGASALGGLPPPGSPGLMPPPSSPPMRPRSHSLAVGLGLSPAFSMTGGASAVAAAPSSLTPPQFASPAAAAPPVPLLQSSSRFLPFLSYAIVSKLGAGSFGDVYHVRVEREEWAQNHYPPSLLPALAAPAPSMPGAPVPAPAMLDFALKKARAPFKSLMARNRVIHQFNLLFSMWTAPASAPPVADSAAASLVPSASSSEPALAWHPNLVAVHAVWQEASGLLHEVMELCPSPSWPFRGASSGGSASGSVTLEEFFICLREGVERRARGQLPEAPRASTEGNDSSAEHDGAFKTPGQEEEEEDDAAGYRSPPAPGPAADFDGMTDAADAEADQHAQDDRSSCNTVHSPAAVASACGPSAVRTLLQFPLVAAPVFEGGVHPCERELWRMIAQIGSALAHLHAHRILHFDVKPGNIFCTEEPRTEPDVGGEEQPDAEPVFLYKLGDFGSVVSLTDYIHGGGGMGGESFEAQEGDGDFLAPEVLNPLACMKAPQSQERERSSNQMLLGRIATGGAHADSVVDEAQAAAKEAARLALARELAPKVDVYSFGMSIFSLITGRLLGRQLITPTEPQPDGNMQAQQQEDDGSMGDAAPAAADRDRAASPEVPRMRHYHHGDDGNASSGGRSSSSSGGSDLFVHLQFPVSTELRSLVEQMLDMDPRHRPSMSLVVDRANAMVREHEKMKGRQQQLSDSSSAAASSASAVLSHSGSSELHMDDEDAPVTPRSNVSASNAAPIHPVDSADHALLSSPLKRSASDPNTHRAAEMMQVLRVAGTPPGSGSNGGGAAESKGRATAERQSSSPLRSANPVPHSKSLEVINPATAAAASAKGTASSSGEPSSPLAVRRGPRSLFPAATAGVSNKQQPTPSLSPGSASPPVRASFSSSGGGGSSSGSSLHSASNSLGGFPGTICASGLSGAPSMSNSSSECSSNATSPPVSTTVSPQLSGITSSLSISTLSLPVLAAFATPSSAFAPHWGASFNMGSVDGSRALLSMGLLQPMATSSNSPSASPSPPQAQHQPSIGGVARSAHAPMVGSGRMPVKRSSLHLPGSRAAGGHSSGRGGGRGGAATAAGAHQPLSSHAPSSRGPSQRSQSLFSTLIPAAPTPASKDSPRVPTVLPMDESAVVAQPPPPATSTDMDVEHAVIPPSDAVSAAAVVAGKDLG